MTYRKGAVSVIVPRHSGNVLPSTMRGIIKQSGMTVEEFLELL